MNSKPLLQKTLKKAFYKQGIGLHTGGFCELWVHPAPANTGRVLLHKKKRLPLHIDEVQKSHLSTKVGPIETVEHLLASLFALNIDNAIIERAAQVATLEGDIEWGDIGSWAALTDVLPVDAQGNLLAGEVLALDARWVTAYGQKDKLVALIGVEDLVVVDTEDALLVCHKDAAQRVKEVLERLQEDESGRRYT